MTKPIVLGRMEAGAGPLMVLVHGFPLDCEMWSEQVQALARGRRVIAVDLRGRGRSRSVEGADEPWTLDTHADDIACTLDALGAERADVAGLSMGGYIAFALWRRHAERLRSLILVDTKAGADTTEGKEGRTKNAAIARRDGMQALGAVLAGNLLAPGAGEATRAQVARMVARTPAETCARDLLAMRDRPDSTALLPAIDVPALVIRGSEDALVTSELGRQTAAAIPNGSYIEVPRAGHLAPLENPSAVNAAIADFLARNDAKP